MRMVGERLALMPGRLRRPPTSSTRIAPRRSSTSSSPTPTWWSSPRRRSSRAPRRSPGRGPSTAPSSSPGAITPSARTSPRPPRRCCHVGGNLVGAILAERPAPLAGLFGRGRSGSVADRVRGDSRGTPDGGRRAVDQRSATGRAPSRRPATGRCATPTAPPVDPADGHPPRHPTLRPSIIRASGSGPAPSRRSSRRRSAPRPPRRSPQPADAGGRRAIAEPEAIHVDPLDARRGRGRPAARRPRGPIRTPPPERPHAQSSSPAEQATSGRRPSGSWSSAAMSRSCSTRSSGAIAPRSTPPR